MGLGRASERDGYIEQREREGGGGGAERDNERETDEQKDR